MGRPRGPGQLRLAWIREYADDSGRDGEQGVVRSLDGVHAAATCRRAAGNCTGGPFSCFRCQQLFHRQQSGRGWRIHVLVIPGPHRSEQREFEQKEAKVTKGLAATAASASAPASAKAGL